jgi:predicted Zn-dependent protease
VFAANVGKAYALAGRAVDALPYLKRVTASCTPLENPMVQTRAFFYLGMAYETQGDIEAARRAYSVVATRWGGVKPKSITVEAAKARLAKLP